MCKISESRRGYDGLAKEKKCLVQSFEMASLVRLHQLTNIPLGEKWRPIQFFFIKFKSAMAMKIDKKIVKLDQVHLACRTQFGDL